MNEARPKAWRTANNLGMAVVLTPFLLGALAVPLSEPGDPLSWAFAGLAVPLLGLIIWRYLAMRLSFDEEGVSWVGLAGRYHLPWSQIRGVRLGANYTRGRSLILDTDDHPRLVGAITYYWGGLGPTRAYRAVETAWQQHRDAAAKADPG